MGRPKKTEPAVCPHCKVSFEGSGKDRYCSLRRHVKEKHTSVYEEKQQTTIVNVLIVSDEIARSVVTPALVKRIEKEVLSSEGLGVIPLIGALHCNPSRPEMYIAAIPNISKDRMLVTSVDGETQVRSKMEGAQIIMDTVFDHEIRTVSKHINDPFITGMLNHEKFADDIMERIISYLEMLPSEERIDAASELKSRMKGIY
jgi:hypothetical protein